MPSQPSSPRSTSAVQQSFGDGTRSPSTVRGWQPRRGRHCLYGVLCCLSLGALWVLLSRLGPYWRLRLLATPCPLRHATLVTLHDRDGRCLDVQAVRARRLASSSSSSGSESDVASGGYLVFFTHRGVTYSWDDRRDLFIVSANESLESHVFLPNAVAYSALSFLVTKRWRSHEGLQQERRLASIELRKTKTRTNYYTFTPTTKPKKKTGENCSIHGLCRVSNLKDLN